jgi:hypothetical protein
LFLFLAVIPFVSVSSFWECRASGDVLRYSQIGESRHAMIQTCTHKLYCTRVPSCTHFHHSLCHLFDIRVLSSCGSFISNNLHFENCALVTSCRLGLLKQTDKASMILLTSQLSSSICKACFFMSALILQYTMTNKVGIYGYKQA